MGIILFTFLHGFVDGLVNRIPFTVGRTVGTIILVLVAIDYTIMMYKQKKESLPKRVVRLKESILLKIRR